MAVHPIGLPQLLIPLAKVVLVPFLVWMVARNAFTGQKVDAPDFHYASIVLALLANQIALYFFALRMRMILGAFGAPISSFQAQRIHLQSIFYYFALPMTVGLELSRYAKVKALLGNDVRSFTLASALLVDRIIGVLAAAAIAAILLPFTASTTIVKLDFHWFFLAPFFLAAAIPIWVLRRRIRDDLPKAIVLPSISRRYLVLAFLISLLTHVFFACGAYAGSRALSLNVTFEQTLLAVTSAMLFAIIPLSFAGVSLVEAASFGLLVALGMANEQAVMFVVITYFLKLFAAAEGACWEFFDGGRSFVRLLEGGSRANTLRNTRHEN